MQRDDHCLPVVLRLAQRDRGVDRLGYGLVRRAPAEDEGARLAGADGEVGDAGEVLAVERDVAAQHHHVGAGDRAESAVRRAW